MQPLSNYFGLLYFTSGLCTCADREVPRLRDAQLAACQVDNDRRQGSFTQLATGLHVVSTNYTSYRFPRRNPAILSNPAPDKFLAEFMDLAELRQNAMNLAKRLD